MIVFSTVLEVNGSPIVYIVYKNGRLAFLKPSAVTAPILYARASESHWEVRGTTDRSLKQQALREIATAS